MIRCQKAAKNGWHNLLFKSLGFNNFFIRSNIKYEYKTNNWENFFVYFPSPKPQNDIPMDYGHTSFLESK